jgi:CHAT domain-containing protein/Tfp pilus assembly protein PilF
MPQQTLYGGVGLLFCTWKYSCSGLLLALAVMVGTDWAAAEEQPAPQPTATHQQRLKERDRCAEETKKLRAEDKLAEAIATCEKMLVIEREVFGNVHKDVVGSLKLLAQMHEEREDFLAAGKRLEEVLAIQTKLHGESHWRVTDARRSLADLERRRQLGPAKRAQLKQAGQLNNEVCRLYYAKRPQEALPLARKALEIRGEILGREHPDYALSLFNLAAQYRALGQFGQAEPLYHQAAEIRKKALGETHPDYAASLNNLVGLYCEMKDYARANLIARLALEIRNKTLRKTLSQAHPDYATNLSNQAKLYRLEGDSARAEPLYRQVLEIRKKTLGETHPDYVSSLIDLAEVYESMGDPARAEPLYRQVLEIRKKALGETHPDYVSSLISLAEVYKWMGDPARAEPLYRQVLEIRKKVLGETHPKYLDSLYELINLAGHYKSMGDPARAEPLYRQVLEIRKKALGETHHDYAASLIDLAEVYESMGDSARAEPLYRQVLEIRKKTLGETHPDYAASLYKLALVHQARGLHAQAEPLLRASLEISYANLELVAVTQSERAQLASAQRLRHILDSYLSLGTESQVSGAQAYRYVLLWKGAVFVRQHGVLRGHQEPELAALFEEWQQTIRRLKPLAFTLSGPNNQHPKSNRQLAELTEKIDQLESELARRSNPFRTRRAQQQRTLAEVKAALPQDVALIDFLAYDRLLPSTKNTKKSTSESHLAAFVVHATRPITQIDLGPIEEINKAIEAWRATVRNRVVKEGASAPAGALRALLWQPLEKYLDGARTVLISPDGALGQLPFGALPGQKPGSYLLEERAIALVPVPQLLPQMLTGSTAPGVNSPLSLESLLLVGDVDFDNSITPPGSATVSRSALRSTRAGGLPAFGPLTATRAEVLAVRDSFKRRFPDAKVHALYGDQATKTALREQAPKHRYLHLATHGFFAPSELNSALGRHTTIKGDLFYPNGVSSFHPGLLSGIVLAGVNSPSQPDQDDGILTALEAREMDLGGVELAVLSACDTGLGLVAGGEGLLGLQRAFQVAGARSVVASLWQVPDAATQALMAEFYRNLWDKKLGKLQALRQAQLAMLRRYDVQQGQLRGAGPERPVDPKKIAEAQPSPVRVPPLYWAGFVLSGDCR